MISVFGEDFKMNSVFRKDSDDKCILKGFQTIAFRNDFGDVCS